eukprot:Nk52_evm17s32 gene=Nk52_evmTU17s32
MEAAMGLSQNMYGTTLQSLGGYESGGETTSLSMNDEGNMTPGNNSLSDWISTPTSEEEPLLKKRKKRKPNESQGSLEDMNKTMGMYFRKKIELQELAFKERRVRNKDIENENVVAQRIRVLRGALSDLREERDICNSEGSGEYDSERSKSFSDQIRSINGKISKLAASL